MPQKHQTSHDARESAPPLGPTAKITMKPSVVLLGFVLGSAASITFGLFGVVVVFMFLRADHPRLQTEFPSLVANLAAFAGLTVLAALSFYGQLREAAWRRLVIATLLAGLCVAGWWYWPRS